MSELSQLFTSAFSILFFISNSLVGQPVFSLSVGSSGSGNGEFSQANSIAVNPSNGNIYVADRNNERVQIFNSEGVYQSQFGSLGSGNGEFFSNNGCVDMAFDAAGNIWIVDRGNHRVQQFSSAGVYQSQFGSNGSDNGQFNQPNGIAINPVDGNIYVADRNNERIQIFNSAGVYQSQFGSLGSGDGQFFSNNGCIDMAFDAAGNIWVVDRGNHRVQQFNSAGTYQSQFGSNGSDNGQFNQPNGIAINPVNGNIYVADRNNERVQIFNSAGVYQSQFGSLGSGDGQFFSNNGCVDLSFASGAQLWVVDRGNHRIQQFFEAALPVELVHFNAFVKENVVCIEWQTRSEQDNHYFEIERLDHTLSWKIVQRVEGFGNSSEIKNYQIIDPIIQAGIFYYRLKQVDFDGRSSYSEIKQVEVKTMATGIDVFPNPTTNQITIVSKAEIKDPLQIFDTQGNNLMPFIRIEELTSNTLNINVDALPEGLFFLKLGNAISKFRINRK